MKFLPQPVKPEGVIASTHGYKGNVHIQWSDPVRSLNKGDFLFVLINNKGVPFLVEEIIGNGDILKLSHVNSYIEAQELLGQSVSTGTTFQENESEQEYPVGYTLVDVSSGFTATIQSIEHYPQQIIWVARCENQEYLIPFVEEWIQSSDENSRTLKVELPLGLLNLDDAETQD